VPEGDTLFRTAAVLREVLLGRLVTAARGRPDGVQLERVVGSTVTRVEAQGKHLLIDFSDGLTLPTHLRMHGSWHRYRPWETWKRPAARAVAVIQTPNSVAVCFDAPTVELLDTRALALHPQLSTLGPDLLAPEPDLERAIANLGQPARAATPVGEALLDQSLLAGLGNVYRSEVLWEVAVSPFTPLGELGPGVADRLVRVGAAQLAANRMTPDRTTTRDALGGAPGSGGPRRHGERRLNVYGRAGRPCPRCGTVVRQRGQGDDNRPTYWCPGCQR
jgi:endonuclease-8